MFYELDNVPHSIASASTCKVHGLRISTSLGSVNIVTEVFAPCCAGVERTECNVTWVNLSDIATSGVGYYPQYATVDECLLACVYLLQGCVAAQIRIASNSMQCFLLTDANKLYVTVFALGTSLYKLVKNCAPMSSGW